MKQILIYSCVAIFIASCSNSDIVDNNINEKNIDSYQNININNNGGTGHSINGGSDTEYISGEDTLKL